MIIEIPKVSREGSRYVGEEDASILGLKDDRFVKFEAPIRYDLAAQVVSHELVVRGRLELDLQVKCSRCAEFFSTTVKDLSFLRAYDAPEGTETVDLTEDIREDILLNLSGFPLCSPSCKGLCPRCGKNLNEGPCGCGPAQGGSEHWSQLEKLDL